MKKTRSKIYKQVDTILRRCQKRLRLSDWNICLSLVGHSEMQSDTAVAEVRYSFRNLEASIKVLDPKYFEPSHSESIGFNNLEATIYHELLHIIIDPIIDRNKVSEDWHEQVVERIAKALAGI